MRRMVCLTVVFWMAGAEVRASDSPRVEVTASIDGEVLDPSGRFSDDLTGQPPRYYVWRDSDEWRLRSASQRNRLIRFHGSIQLVGGTFGKLRPIGLERRGGAADKWTVSEDRTHLDFEILTTGSFDGFDFSVTGAGAHITFDLKMGKRPLPRRIYIGSEGQHPAEAEFTLPAARTAE
jgi:hypothetical protein